MLGPQPLEDSLRRMPLLLGRLPVVATLDDLDEDALVDILTKPKNALVKQYQRLFEMEDVRLELTDEVKASLDESRREIAAGNCTTRQPK